VTILGQMGLSQWVSESMRGYIDRACQLAGNPDELTQWRHQLRDRMLDSPLTDGQAFARDLERTMRSMWRAELRGLLA